MKIRDNEKKEKSQKRTEDDLALEFRRMRHEEIHEEIMNIFFYAFMVLLAIILCFFVKDISTEKYVNVRVYKEDTLLLEYTGKDNSVKKMNNGYSFTVNEKTYIFKDVDVIEITNLDEGDEK